MHEHQRLIDDIQSLLESGDPLGIDGLGTLAADYAALCDQANERLRVCGELLRKGLRSEALQQAEHEPKLIDLVSLLDFPDAGNWRALLAAHGIAQPPMLLLEVAAELNEAYAIEQPLAELLRRHRWLALARAPLSKRIGILRQIAVADPMNLVWLDDLRSLEQARHQQIESEASQAVKVRDSDRLAELEAELRDNGWSAVPPAELVQSTAQARARVQTASAFDELELLAQQLNDACTASDLQRGQSLRGKWQACLKVAKLPSDHRVLQSAAPALDWLAEADRSQKQHHEHEQEVAALEEALDKGEPRAVLERHFHALERLGLGIPTLLDRRYHERVEQLGLAATRRNRLLIGVAAALLLLIAGVTGAMAFRHARAQEVATRAAVLKGLLAESKLDEARQYLDDLAASRPELATSAEVQEQQTRLHGLEAAEAQRRAAWRLAMDRAQAADPQRPDEHALAEAKRLARTDAERAELVKIEGDVQTVRQRLQAERDARFAQELDTVAEQLKNFEAGQLRSGETPADSIAGISRKLASVLAGSGLASAELQQRANLLKSQLDNHIDAQRRGQRETSLLNRVTDAVGNAAAYQTALQNYISELPQSPRSISFQRVIAEEAPLWEGLSRWNEAVRKWSAIDTDSLSPQAAAALVKEAEPLLEVLGDYPQAARLRDRMAHWQAVASRVAEDGTRIHMRLLSVFNDPAVAGLWMVRDRQGRNYYSKSQPQALPPTLRVKHLTGFDFSEQSVPLNLDQVVLNERAPQSVLAEAAIKELTALTDGRWDAAFARLVERIYADEKLDPLLKATFLRRVVDVASQGSHIFAQAFEPYRQKLSAPELKLDANWLKPGDSEAATARVVAAAVLESLPAPSELQKTITAAHSALKQPIAPRYAWAGWLVKDANVGWRCATGTRTPATGELWVVHRPAGDSAVAIAKVGELRGGNAILTLAGEAELVEGRPVFVTAPADN